MHYARAKSLDCEKITTDESSNRFFLLFLPSIRSIGEKSISFIFLLRFTSMFVESERIGEVGGEKSRKNRFDFFSPRVRLFFASHRFVFRVFLHQTSKPHKLKLSFRSDFESCKSFSLNVFLIIMVM